METIINEALLADFNKKLAKLNARAAKLGMEQVSVSVVETFEDVRGVVGKDPKPLAGYRVMDGNKERWAVMMVRLNVEGQAPKLNGYQFVATVDLRGENPVVRAVPFIEGVDLTPFFSTDCHCDHCNSSRRRNDVLVVREIATGKLMQIGRNCAADFFRSTDALQMLSVSESIFGAYGNDDEDLWGGVRAEPYVSLTTLFAQAAAVVRKFGWVSTRMAERDATLFPTRARVWNNLFPWPQMPVEDRVTPIEEDYTVAADVVAWLMAEFVGKPAHARSDFERNVVAVIEGVDELPRARVRNLNFLIWAIDGYKRELEKRVQRQIDAQRTKSSAHVGTVGERTTFSLTLRFRKVFDSQFGRKALCKFTEANGNTVIWWGTSDAAFDMKLDHEYIVKATVKAHGDRDGEAQTEITRVSVVEGELVAA